MLFENIRFPKPVLTMAVSAEKKGEEDKIFQGLQKLGEEDYTFSVRESSLAGETLLSGQGEIHLEVLAKKLKNKFGVGIVLRTPSVEYKETIRATATAEGKYKKQSGGHGQYGHCKMRFEPYDGDFLFAEEVVGGSVPKQYIPAVEKGIRECLGTGVLAGYPVTGLKAVLYDGSYHEVDSSEMAFKAAANIAFKEGLKNAKPVLLEPIMKLRVIIPEAYFGAVMGDIVKRRGRIVGTDVAEGKTVLSAEVPQSEILKYATDLCWRYLSSRAVTRKVLSAKVSLTSVFGMGTGGPSPQSTPTSSRQIPYPSPRSKAQGSVIPLSLLSMQNRFCIGFQYCTAKMW